MIPRRKNRRGPFADGYSSRTLDRDDLPVWLGQTRGRYILAAPLSDVPRRPYDGAHPPGDWESSHQWPQARGGDGKAAGPSPGPGHLLCSCWCGLNTVWVTDADVLNGRTLACGLDICTPEIGLRHDQIRRKRRKR